MILYNDNILIIQLISMLLHILLKAKAISLPVHFYHFLPRI